ncbi:LOW QUALITY PROTEIN: hypothetical protein CVT25_001752 [Psilocybe cyanescens]|uniref:NADH:flavin oxidoreductase/NADH oxidase N-terminal domain-containing protein n=1 Tax=Psilocybe cyanescens TaxID=93625 RepID=A0A409WPQ9_PSICY|nr:LOW QUALITY PROTEIN: hypothetical protein CVT25_001752 [Psilocybe cyanescens]
MNSSEILPAPGASFYTPLQSLPAGTALVKQRSGKPIPKAFEPLRIRGVEFPNRIFVGLFLNVIMETRTLSPKIGGIVSRGPGLSFVEATAVTPEGRITPQDVGIWSDAHADALSKLVEFAHSQSQKIAIQLAHAGRKASTTAPWLDGNGIATKELEGWPDNVWGPSSIPFAPGYPVPKELTVEEIKGLVTAFAEGAKRAVTAGFDVIEIHNAHGFLLNSFISGTSNKRTDQYGGSFENRIRFTLEVVDAGCNTRKMPLFLRFRISATEWLEVVAPNEPSWTSEDTVRFASILVEHGIDLLDVSAGGNSPLQELRSGPEYQVPFSADVKAALGSKILVGAVGGLFEAKIAEAVLDSGRADVIFIGRQFEKNPGHVWAIADELAVDAKFANQMQWGFRGRGDR